MTTTLVPVFVPQRRSENEVWMCVQNRLKNCSYANAFKDIRWKFEFGVLTLLGRVDSFYLKQMVQELLRDVDHVELIDNRVKVVWPTETLVSHSEACRVESSANVIRFDEASSALPVGLLN